MATEKIVAETRTEFGKGAARRIRRENKIPAVIYGHQADPIHLTLPYHDTMMALRNHGPNALLDVSLAGKNQLALTKDIQVEPIKRIIEHVDFIAVRAGEKVTVDVPVEVTGEAAAGTMVNTESQTVTIEAEATHVPETIEVSIEGAEAGTQIHAGELTLPQGTTLAADEDLLIVQVSEEQEIEEEPVEEDDEAAEGDVVPEEGEADDSADEE